MEKLEVGDIVLCIVERITKTIVFVSIKGNEQGSIIMSEVAPGRIRNVRDYVVPKKTIVCKVLRVSGERIDLSLRRVTQKEKKEILEQNKKEKSYKAVLKKILEKNAEEAIKKIEKEDNLYDFLENSKENSKDLEDICGKENAHKIMDILKSQKKKKVILKKEVKLITTRSNGINLIKKIFKEIKNISIKYISAGRYLFESESEDIKEADKKLKNTLENLERVAKKEGIEFSIKDNNKSKLK